MSSSRRAKTSFSTKNSPRRLSNIDLNMEPSNSKLLEGMEKDLQGKIESNLVRITKVAR